MGHCQRWWGRQSEPGWEVPSWPQPVVTKEPLSTRKQVKHLIWRLSLLSPQQGWVSPYLTQHLPILHRSVAPTTRPMTPPAISLPLSAPWREPRKDTSCTWTTLGLANVSGAIPLDKGSPNLSIAPLPMG